MNCLQQKCSIIPSLDSDHNSLRDEHTRFGDPASIIGTHPYPGELFNEARNQTLGTDSRRMHVGIVYRLQQ